MRQIVLEIISHSKTNMNGIYFDRYKLKLKEDNKIFVTDGFGQDGASMIKIGDIIEYMEVVGHLTGEELCRTFYEVKKIEKHMKEQHDEANKNRRIEKKVVPVVAKKFIEKPKASVEQMSLF